MAWVPNLSAKVASCFVGKNWHAVLKERWGNNLINKKETYGHFYLGLQHIHKEPEKKSHIWSDSVDDPVVLLLRQGRETCRT